MRCVGPSVRGKWLVQSLLQALQVVFAALFVWSRMRFEQRLRQCGGMAGRVPGRQDPTFRNHVGTREVAK